MSEKLCSFKSQFFLEGGVIPHITSTSQWKTAFNQSSSSKRFELTKPCAILVYSGLSGNGQSVTVISDGVQVFSFVNSSGGSIWFNKIVGCFDTGCVITIGGNSAEYTILYLELE